MLALYRFWPGAQDAVVGALAAAPVRSTTSHGVHVPRVQLLHGPYALAIEVEGDPPAEVAAGIALDLVAAIVDGRAVRRSGGREWTCDLALRAGTLGEDDGASASRPLLVFRTRGGWNVVGAPEDQESWLALSMTFLNRELYERVDPRSAWLEPEVLEVAALVLGTHRPEDVEGTCGAYGIPGGQVPRWRDDQREASAGIPEIVQCASVLLGTALDSVVRASAGRLAVQ